MSDNFESYLAWLDFTELDRAPGYYALLGLPCFESDLDRIEQALFQQSLEVSRFLSGPRRGVAESVLAEINLCEDRLINPASKAAYDAQLRATLAETAPSSSGPHLSLALDDEAESETESILLNLGTCATQAASQSGGSVQTLMRTSPESLPGQVPEWAMGLTELPRQVDPEVALSVISSTCAEAEPSGFAAPASPPADRLLGDEPRPRPAEARRGAPPRIKNDGVHETAARKPPAARRSLAAGFVELIGGLCAPLLRRGQMLAVGLVVAAGVWGAYRYTQSAKEIPPRTRQFVVLDPKEKLLVGEQIGVLYDLKQDLATRTAAADKLRSISPAAVHRYSFRLKDLAEKQPEESLKQTLRSILENAGSPP